MTNSLIRRWLGLDDSLFGEPFPCMFSTFELVERTGELAMNVKETEKEVIVEIELPGFDPEKMEVSVENDILKVSGKREKEEKKEKEGYLLKEIRHDSFEKAVRLPAPVKEDAVEATYERGVLKIVMPKAEAKPVAPKIKIKVKENK